MKKLQQSALVFTLICVSTHIFSQKETNLEKNQFQILTYIPSEIKSESPSWVKTMYSESDNLNKIISQYESYYEENPFVKNQHTQYYKRLLRAHSRANIDFTKSVDEQSKLIQEYKKRRQAFKNKTSQEWSAIGPTNLDIDAAVSGNTPGTTHVYSLSFCNGLEQHILAGTASAGLWKSSNNGHSWELISADLPATKVKAAAYKPMNPSEIYMASNNIFYKSINGGNTWYETGGSELSSYSYNAFEILFQDDQEDKLFLATSRGFYKSNDGGENFELKLSGNIIDIETHPTDNQVVYAIKVIANRTEFYRSDDGGENFIHQSSGYPSPSSSDEQKRTVIAVSDAEPDAVFALAVGKMNNGDGLVGIYKSDNKGTDWIRKCCGDTEGGLASIDNPNIMEWNCSGVNNGGQYYYDLAIGVNNSNSNELITGGINLWKSSDGGSTMECLSDYIHKNREETYVHADIHDIKYIDGVIWIASDGGIFRSLDNSQTFHKRMNGLHGTDFRGFDVSFYNKNIMLGGTYHNGTMLKEGNTYINQWVSTRSGDNSRAFVNKGNSEVIYDHSGIRKLTGDRFLSPKNQNLSRKPNASFTVGESSEIVFHPHNFNTFFLGQFGSLYKSTNNGVSFDLIKNFGSGKVTSIEISSIDPNLIYLVYYPSYSAPKKIMKSIDGGGSWQDISVPQELYNNEDYWVAWDITVGSTSPFHLWAVRTPQTTTNLSLDDHMVYFSPNGGETWENITSPSLNGEFPTCIVHQEGTANTIYLGTRRGVYYYTNGNWELMANGIPASTFSTKLVPHYSSGKLINATQRGIYEIDLIGEGGLAVPMVSRTYSNCLRDTFYFMDKSPVLENSTRLWTFEGADNLHSDEISPKVTYSEPGIYPVKLEVFTAHGDYEFESLDFIEVQDGCGLETSIGKALTTGNASYCKVPSFDKTVTEFTVSAWIKRNGPIYNNAGVIVHRSGPEGTGIIISSSGYLGALWNEVNPSFISDLYVPYNKWAHIAMTVSQEGISLYLNGLEEFFPREILPVSFSEFFYLGTDEFAVSNYFTGMIDEVKFYDKALSQDEIQISLNLTEDSQSEGLFAYFQANNESGILTDRIGLNHAFMIENATRSTSLAPVSSGCAELLEIYSPGTYDFDCAGVSMTFEEGDVLPNGPVSVTRLDELPDLPNPDGNQISESYWVINNYGSNQSISSPKNLTISGFGETNDIFMDYPEYFSLYMIPNFWEYGWGGSIDSADSLNMENNTTVVFDEAESMTYFGKLIMVEEGLPSLSAWNVSLTAELQQNQVVLNWSEVNENSTYELMKSSNGKDFHVIDSGYGNFLSDDFFVDSKLDNNILYYKLKVINEFGKEKVTEIISITISTLDDIRIFPNVVSQGNQFTIDVGDNENVRWRLFDTEGRFIKEEIQSISSKSYAVNWTSGNYIIEFDTNNTNKTSFLVVQ